MFTADTIRKTVFDAVFHLAAEYEDQLKYLNSEPKIALPVDELAIEFGECLLVVNSNKNLQVSFSDEELLVLSEIDAFLKEISGEKNATLWTLEALRGSWEWRHVRDRAGYLIDLSRTG